MKYKDIKYRVHTLVKDSYELLQNKNEMSISQMNDVIRLIEELELLNFSETMEERAERLKDLKWKTL